MSFSDISVIVTGAVQVVEQVTQAGFLIITQSHTDYVLFLELAADGMNPLYF